MTEPQSKDRSLPELLRAAERRVNAFLFNGASADFARIPADRDHDVDLLLCEAADSIEEHDHSFDLRWKADMRAIKRWQAEAPGRELTWPDHADLCVWLLERLDILEAGIRKVIQECGNCGGQGFEYVDDGTGEDVIGEACPQCSDLRELIGEHTNYRATHEIESGTLPIKLSVDPAAAGRAAIETAPPLATNLSQSECRTSGHDYVSLTGGVRCVKCGHQIAGKILTEPTARPFAERQLLAWAYSKLMTFTFSDQKDALALDEIKLTLQE